MLSGNYVMTIDSDDEVPIQSTKAKDEGVQFDMNFVFDPSNDALPGTLDSVSDLRDFIKTGSRPVRTQLLYVFSVYAQYLPTHPGAHFR